ncbi:MAG: formate/nitrite transporter family protein [Oscillospiraceae bacterium]
MYTPKEIAENYLSACRTKARCRWGGCFCLPALRAPSSRWRAPHPRLRRPRSSDPSLAKLVSGCVFPAGLAMVIVAGSELFTGNNLMIMGVLSRVICARQMLRNWCVVYLGNFVGAALVAALCVLGHVFSAFDGRLAASVIAIAQTKAALPFGDAFVRGILCNFLVCIAVWMANAARTVGGKIAAVFFPIMAFVVCGL